MAPLPEDDTAAVLQKYPEPSKLPAALPDDEPVKWRVPVDSEHKSKLVKLWSVRGVHMRCFHLNWVAFFITFASAYAAASLVPYIRDDLNLTQFSANVASVVTTAGTVFSRVAIGQCCDYFGVRYSYALLLMFTAIPVLNMANVQNATGYIALRTLIGSALASFVCCQYWTSSFFSPNVVGIANATAGGWGNAGGGVTQLIMPRLAKKIRASKPYYQAWRYAFWLPGFLHIGIATLILAFGQDTPDGNFRSLDKKGKKAKANPKLEWRNVLTDYRVWGLAACYAYSFGVELVMNNALAPYFEANFNFGIEKSANLAAIFGTMNFVSRPLGGVFSDLAARYWGMRGRLWVNFIAMFAGGIFCVCLGVSHNSLTLTLVFVVCCAFCLEATCGTVYGIVPFVSRRSCGLVSGIVSAGGAVGGVINQAIFFLNTPANGSYYIARQDAFKWMGVVIMAVTVLGCGPIQFPMWGGLLWGPRKGATEEDYYYAEYNEGERAQGLHLASSKFAFESRSQRGMRSLSKLQAAEAKAIGLAPLGA